MKVFADTNFLICAFSTRGLSADVFQLILAEHQLQYGEFVLAVFSRVLLEKFNLPEPIVIEALALIRLHHIEPLPDRPSLLQLRDEDDRWVLESAIQAKADVLITGDKDLLAVADQVGPMKILTPRGFWALIQAKET